MMPTRTPTTTMMAPESCDYLIVGGGATGMAFVDSLLQGSGAKPSVVMLDPHGTPGGQWNDSYDFVQLHQPSSTYGVESTPLEPVVGDEEHLATRVQILNYYDQLAKKWTDEFDFSFLGGANVDLTTSSDEDHTYSYALEPNGSIHTITVRRRLVDARYLQPDLPIHVPPRFDFDPDKINCIPINSLVASSSDSTASDYFVVIGGGKTGMDAVHHLLTTKKVPPAHIVWVVPHDPWITAREKMGNCMEFLHSATKLNLDMQATFRQWEQEGKIYRLWDDEPTKFQDATLSQAELAVLRQLPASNLVRGRGRVVAIQDDGKLRMSNGVVLELPFPPNATPHVTFVHCSAGAFNYSRQIGTQPLPVFQPRRITLQDVYGAPGFCFAGSILGKLESIATLTDDQRNSLCRAPGPTQAPTSALGFTSGLVGDLTPDHGWVLRLGNLRGWLQTPELRQWLVGHRLFNLRHKSAEDMDRLVEETWNVLKERALVE